MAELFCGIAELYSGGWLIMRSKTIVIFYINVQRFIKMVCTWIEYKEAIIVN